MMLYKADLVSFLFTIVTITNVLAGWSNSEATHFKFDFGAGKVERGYVQVLPTMNYARERGFGFYCDSTMISIERNGNDALRSDFCTSTAPFIFAVDVPEGNYNIKVILGDEEGETITTIKAESRRLMLEQVHTAPGEFKTVTFTTNVRHSHIDSSDSVKLNPREIGHPNWDHQLTIEFNNSRPCVCAMEIMRTDQAITVFLAGNSTVTDQKDEPWASWGQMLPRFFQPEKIAVANHAESGEALKSFIVQNRLKKIMSTIKSGDYLFIEFGHNDQKPQNAAYVEPFTGYKEYLKHFIGQARQHGATPVLVTPVYRRRFDENGRIVNSHGDYPEAMRQTAREEHVALIDLFTMSGVLFEALGVEGSKKAFVHYPAGTFPGQKEELKDDSHFNNYGAYQLAKCIVEGIKSNQLDLARYLVDDVPPFDPAHPDPVASWSLPIGPMISVLKPEGR